MELKTLLKLIRDDIAHLDGITNDFLLESLLLSDEVELALVRAKALLRELELLHKFTAQHDNSSKTIQPTEIPKVEVDEPDQTEQELFEIFDVETNEDQLESSLEKDEQNLVQDQDVSKVDLQHVDQPEIEELSEVSMEAISIEEQSPVLAEPVESSEIVPVIPIDIKDQIDEPIVPVNHSVDFGEEILNKIIEKESHIV